MSLVCTLGQHHLPTIPNFAFILVPVFVLFFLHNLYFIHFLIYFLISLTLLFPIPIPLLLPLLHSLLQPLLLPYAILTSSFNSWNYFNLRSHCSNRMVKSLLRNCPGFLCWFCILDMSILFISPPSSLPFPSLISLTININIWYYHKSIYFTHQLLYPMNLFLGFLSHLPPILLDHIMAGILLILSFYLIP